MGTSAKKAARAVMTTGRVRCLIPSAIASDKLISLFKFSLNSVIRITPFCTQMPKSAMNPTPAEIPKLMPVTRVPTASKRLTASPEVLRPTPDPP